MHGSGVILQAKDCKHLSAPEGYCPTCGSYLDEEYSSGNTTSKPIDLGYFSLPPIITGEKVYKKSTKRDEIRARVNKYNGSKKTSSG